MYYADPGNGATVPFTCCTKRILQSIIPFLFFFFFFFFITIDESTGHTRTSTWWSDESSIEIGEAFNAAKASIAPRQCYNFFVSNSRRWHWGAKASRNPPPKRQGYMPHLRTLDMTCGGKWQTCSPSHSDSRLGACGRIDEAGVRKGAARSPS